MRSSCFVSARIHFSCYKTINCLLLWSENYWKTNSVYFFIEQIISKNIFRSDNEITLGFCTKNFDLNNYTLGFNWTIGFTGREFRINGNIYEKSRDFEIGDVAGLGLIKSTADSSIKCFATLNNLLLGNYKNKSMKNIQF